METQTKESYTKDICDKFNSFRSCKKYCDFVLEANDDKHVAVHKLVLLATCSAIEGLLEYEPSVDRFKLNIDIKNLENLVNYLYTGTVSLTVDNVQELYQSSKALTLSHELEGRIIDYMKRHVNDYHCLKFWRFAAKSKIKTLEEACIEHYVMHFESAVKADLLGFDETEFVQIISAASLTKVHPTDLYANISKWVRHDIPSRKFILPSLFEKLDFTKFRGEFIRSTIVEDTFIFKHEQFTTQVMHLLNSDLSGFNVQVGHIYFVTRTSVNKLDFTNKKFNEIYKMKEAQSHALTTISSTEFLITGGTKHDKAGFNSCKKYISNYDQPIEFQYMNVGRSYHRMESFKNEFYACGGLYGEKILKSVESFNLEIGKWTYRPTLCTARHSFGLVGVENCLYAIGGKSDEGILVSSIERYDVRQYEWRITGAAQLEGYCSLNKSVNINDKIYCFNSLGQGVIFDIRKMTTSCGVIPTFHNSNVVQRPKWQTFDITEYNGSIYGVFFHDLDWKKLYECEYPYDKWTYKDIQIESVDYDTTNLINM